MSRNNFLLELARKTVEEKSREFNGEPHKDTLEKQGCFVTLTINGQLRGCIGHIIPVYPLYQGVIENAFAAAFRDPRFLPVSSKELTLLKYEISILTLPVVVEYSSVTELESIIQKEKDGIIIEHKNLSATFLPQVWKDLPDFDSFFSHLCMKAGLPEKTYKKEKILVKTYQCEIIT